MKTIGLLFILAALVIGIVYPYVTWWLHPQLTEMQIFQRHLPHYALAILCGVVGVMFSYKR